MHTHFQNNNNIYGFHRLTVCVLCACIIIILAHGESDSPMYIYIYIYSYMYVYIYIVFLVSGYSSLLGPSSGRAAGFISPPVSVCGDL